MEDRILKRAFALDDIMPDNIDLDAPPVSGLDYLYRVRLEARNCPKVVVANIDAAKFHDRQTVKVDIYSGFITAREGFKPDPEWQKKVLEEFRYMNELISENREMLKSKFPIRPVPKINNIEEWCLYCLGNENWKKLYDESDVSENTECDPPKSKKSRFNPEYHLPLLSVLINFDQNRFRKVLSHFDVWLNDLPFSDHIGKWIFSLLLCLEKPLSPDTCSTLRSISRQCCKFRDGISDPEDLLLKPLNSIITIIAHYFDQIDLCDNFHTPT